MKEASSEDDYTGNMVISFVTVCVFDSQVMGDNARQGAHQILDSMVSHTFPPYLTTSS